MSDLLFATPWWLLATLIVVGAIVFWTGLQKQQSNPRYVGLGLIVLAIVLFSLRFFVETDREKCEKQSTELVNCVEKRDWTTFTSLLDDEVTLGTADNQIFGSKQKLIDGAKKDTEVYNPTNVGVRIANSEQDASGVTVDIDVSSEGSITMGYRVPTSWKLIWQKSGNDWRLHQIICTKIGNQTGNEMARDIAK
jgi:hypothetical protein